MIRGSSRRKRTSVLPDGEAKFWIEPRIQLARTYQLSEQDLSRVLQLVVDHEQEIRDAWQRHFGR
jgi:hypothetical protein